MDMYLFFGELLLVCRHHRIDLLRRNLMTEQRGEYKKAQVEKLLFHSYVLRKITGRFN
jgi:hypothetical protein